MAGRDRTCEGAVVTFEEVVDQAIAMLQRRGRVTYRMLKRQFDLDDEALDDLRLELIKGQRLAADEDGDVLVWSGAAAAPSPAADGAVVPAHAPEVTPLTYTPSHLTEKILAARPALEGERKQVTVLFADLKDSTELIRGLDPEAAQQPLDVGKSRLVHEVLHSHRTQGWRVLESASVSYGKATPYFPVIDLLKRYCHIDDGDEARTIRARVTGQILTLDETLQETLPALLALLDVLPDDSPFGHLDPSQRRQRTLEALRRVLLRESQVQPLLLVCEDLHWIDSATQALLDRLIESLPTAPLLLLVNYRPEYQHGWGSKTYYTQLRLDPLPPASAEAFLAGLLGNDPSLAPLLPLLLARTAGNPFFLEESVRTLVETAALVATPGAYRLAAPLQGLPVPATVQAVLAARIDRLAPEEKGLLQTAAVLGPDVPFALLRAIADVPEAALHRGLAHLQAAEFLYETRLYPEPEYTFKHALTHEVAYGSLLLERRRGLHARLVEAIEALAPDRGSQGTSGRSADQVERLGTMPCGARYGTRPCPGARRLAPGPGPAPRSARRWPHSSRPSRPSRTCPSTATSGCWPLRSASLWETRWSHWESMGDSSPCWARPRPWPGRSTIGPDSDGCWPRWPGCSGSRETSTAPWRQASRPSPSRSNSARAPCRWKHPCT